MAGAVSHASQQLWFTTARIALRFCRNLPVGDVATIFLVLGIALLYGAFSDGPDPLHHLWFERRQQKHAQRRQIVKQTRSISRRLVETGRRVVIFWGSQTGTGEGIANALGKELQSRLDVGALVADLSDFDPESITDLNETLMIFVLSTYGEGDPSDNATSFCNWLSHTSDGLENIQYAAFGLGNSDYKNYNNVVNAVSGRLDERGARPILKIGRADASKSNPEEEFLDWKEDLLRVLRDCFGYRERDIVYNPTLKVIEDCQAAATHVGQPVQRRAVGPAALASKPLPLPLENSRNLSPNAIRPCLHLEFHLASPSLKYKAGDHLAIWPKNPESEVERLLKALGMADRRHKTILVTHLGTDHSSTLRIPGRTTLDALLRHYVSICNPVSQDTLRSLLQFAPSSAARDFLIRLSQDKAAYVALRRQKVTLGRILELANGGGRPWKELPLSWILESLPPLQPRLYSISSSSVSQPRRVAITVVMTDETSETKDVEPRFGLTTNYLHALHYSQANGEIEKPEDLPYDRQYPLDGPGALLKGGEIFAQLCKSKYKLPLSPSCPIVMVGAGAGVAPFRGFIQERALLRRMGQDIGSMQLYFGCRYADRDFLYEDEFADLKRELGPTFDIITAFSRQPEATKCYVQHRMVERRSELVATLMRPDCSFYVCGSARMAREVVETVAESLKAVNNWNNDDAYGFMERARRVNRWHEEVWG